MNRLTDHCYMTEILSLQPETKFNQPFIQLSDLFFNLSRVMRKPVYANNKGADQSCRLISAFVVRCLDSIISLVSISKISSL